MPSQRCFTCCIQYTQPLTVLKEVLSPDLWHTSVKSLIDAAKLGCEACSLICTGFSEFDLDWPKNGQALIEAGIDRFPSIRVKDEEFPGNGLIPDFYVHTAEITRLLKGV